MGILQAKAGRLEQEIEQCTAEQNKHLAEQQLYVANMMTPFNDAVSRIRYLRSADIVEVKCMAHPSFEVRLAMEGLCLMFNIEAVLRSDQDRPALKIYDYWNPAKRLLLCDAKRLIENICAYDMNHMSPEVLQRLAGMVLH